MPLHINSHIDTSPSSTATLFSRAGPIVSPLTPTTQSDILAILQQEQDHAVSLLSLSPLLSSLFISYATRATALRSTSTTPPSESDEWKTFHDTIATLQEENEKLKSEAHETATRLEAAEASQEELRSQVLALKEVNTTQEGDIKSLRAQVSEAQRKYDQLVEDSNAEKAALKAQISDLQTQRGHLRETAVKQQIRITKLERPVAEDAARGPMSPPPLRPGGSMSTPSLPDSPISPFQPSLPPISSPYGNSGLVGSPPCRSPLRPHPMSLGLIGTRHQPSAGNLRSETALSGWFGDDN